MTANLKFGLVLPHFGQHASTKKCLEGSIQAEAYGFDSVWVRDHLVFTPYAMEGTDNTHIEGLLILSAVAAVTRKLTLGTAMTICHRNPIHLAQCFAALSRITNGRVIMGMGLGGFPHEFAAGGAAKYDDRACILGQNQCGPLPKAVGGRESFSQRQLLQLPGRRAETSTCKSYSDLVWRLDIGGLPACGGVWRRVAARANHRRNLYKASRISSGSFANGGTSHDYGGSDALDQHRQR